MGSGNIIWIMALLGISISLRVGISLKVKSRTAWLWTCLSGVMIGAVLGLVAAFMIGSELKMELRPLSNSVLVSLKENNQGKAVYFLSQNKNTFVFNTQAENEGYHPNIVVADFNNKVVIFEDTEWFPTVAVWEYTPVNKFLNWLAIVPVENRDKEYRFHLPPGTLKQDHLT